jgi:acetyl esterase
MDVHARVEPGTVARLDALARWDTTSIATIRATYAEVAPPPVPPAPGVERRDDVLGGVRVRWYRPAQATGALPCVVYLHGGAYIMGTLDENDERLDRMVLEAGCAVVSVEWRLAPEHPYPAGLDDAEAVWRALTADPAASGVDGAGLVLAGASAGAGLAAALCLRLRDAGGVQPRLQLLVYPMLDDRPSDELDEPGHRGLWQRRAEELSWAAYLGERASDPPPTAVPARAGDLSGVAPAFLAIGDADAYLAANLAYAAQLGRDAVPVELHVYPGVIHGGFQARPATPRTRQFLRDVHQALRLAFEHEVEGLS